MNLEKRFVGADMLQYGHCYEQVKQYHACLQIYDAVTGTYNDKAEQTLELSFLKQAYEGIVRLTNDIDKANKLSDLNVLMSKL